MKAGRNNLNQLTLKRHLVTEERDSLPKLLLQCNHAVWTAQLDWRELAFLSLFSACILYWMYLFSQHKFEQVTFFRDLLHEFWKVINGGVVKFCWNKYSQAQTNVSIHQLFPFTLAELISGHEEHRVKVQMKKRNISGKFSMSQSSCLFLHSQISVRILPFKKAWNVENLKTTFPFLHPGICLLLPTEAGLTLCRGYGIL